MDAQISCPPAVDGFCPFSFGLYCTALLSALLWLGLRLCSVVLPATTSKLGGNGEAAKQFLFLGIAVTKLQPLGQLNPPERYWRTRL